MYILGALAGLAFGSLAAYLNSLLTRRYLRKNSGRTQPEGTAAAMGLTFMRQIINIIALAIVFFLRNVVPLPFIATICGTAAGLTAVSFVFISKITKNP
jgi:hypothetical protein